MCSRVSQCTGHASAWPGQRQLKETETKRLLLVFFFISILSYSFTLSRNSTAHREIATMAEKEATVYIVDVGASMGACNGGREVSDLDWAMKYVWDKITTAVWPQFIKFWNKHTNRAFRLRRAGRHSTSLSLGSKLTVKMPTFRFPA